MEDESAELAVEYALDVLARETTPFLKTCPECKTPLREGKRVAIVVQTLGNWRESTSHLNDFYCPDHSPTSDELVEELLCSQAAVVEVELKDGEETPTGRVQDVAVADDRPFS